MFGYLPTNLSFYETEAKYCSANFDRRKIYDGTNIAQGNTLNILVIAPNETKLVRKKCQSKVTY